MLNILLIYIILILNKGTSNEEKYRQGATGGITAAPVTASIYRRIFPILGITKNFNLSPELLVNNKGELDFVSY